MSKSQTQLFGRAWELTIAMAPDDTGTPSDAIVVSSSAWDPETLRITFEVTQTAYKHLWFATISIYNLNAPTTQKVLTQGAQVTLQAGYQHPGMGTIFQGQVYQPIWELENVVDYKLTLLCYCGLKQAIGNYASFSGSPQDTQANLVAKAAATAFHPITLGSIDTTVLANSTLPRPRAFFGDPNQFFDDIAAGNKMVSWMGPDGVEIADLETAGSTADIVYTPTTGIIGSPQQTEDGVSFRVLLDPRLQIRNPPMQVGIDNAVIRSLARYPGQYPPLLDKDGLYIPMGLTFVGDSRGEGVWYTDIVAATSVGGKLAMIYEQSKKLDRRSAR